MSASYEYDIIRPHRPDGTMPLALADVIAEHHGIERSELDGLELDSSLVPFLRGVVAVEGTSTPVGNAADMLRIMLTTYPAGVRVSVRH